MFNTYLLSFSSTHKSLSSDSDTLPLKVMLNANSTATACWEVLNFFESVGLLLKRGYLDKEDAWEMFSCYVFPLHATTSALIDDYRKNDVNTLTNFTYLFEALVGVEKSHNGISQCPSASDLARFWKGEANILAGSPMKSRRTRSRNRKKLISEGPSLFETSDSETATRNYSGKMERNSTPHTSESEMS